MIGETIRNFKRRYRVSRALDELNTRRFHARPHSLDKPLIVSLTSYPKRFDTLDQTLRCLLRQTVKPDRTVLYLAFEDERLLPVGISALREEGLEIETCRDLRSLKKLAPALDRHPDSYIVTADDDVHYSAEWLNRLVDGAVSAPGEIIAHRAHRIRRLADGTVAPYSEWVHNVAEPASGTDLCATGVGGVLYPPGSLDARCTDEDLFLRLAPTADDMWLYWMARMKRSTIRKIGGKYRVLEWPGSQETSLRSVNVEGLGNDAACAALTAHFGPPP